MNIADNLLLADLIALRPMSYVIRGLIALSAFAAAMNIEKVVTRVIGFVFLLLTGGGLLLTGLKYGTAVDLAAGIVVLGAAGYSWWFTRV